MKDSTALLLKLINEGKTINEISEVLGISNKKIYNVLTMIRNKGFEFDRKYYYNGDIIYVPKKTFIETKHDGVDIITSPSDEDFEALVISDLHIGSDMERIDLLNMAYDYCAKEGIHIIIICGDFIDGMIRGFSKKHDNVYDQIDYSLQNYPFDKSILNFITLGDHDFSALEMYGQNLARVFENYRHDIVSLGYGNGKINVKNDSIFVKHPADTFDHSEFKCPNQCLILRGHSHEMMKIKDGNGSPMIITTAPFCEPLQSRRTPPISG